MVRFSGRKLFLIFAAMLVTMLGAGRAWWAQTPSANHSPSNKHATSSASPENSARQSKDEIRARLETLISLARSASPEMEADLLFAALSSNLISDKEREIELIDEAFQAAARVKEPVRQRSWNSLVDTRSGFKQRAFDLQLDRLSIQSQAISRMIPVDSLRARVMFQSVKLPKIEPLSCKDSLVADFTAYYQAALSVAQHGFTPDEMKAQAHIQFLTDQVETVKTVPQAGAALKVLTNATLSDEELARVVISLAKGFGQASDDPRAFAFAVQRDGFITTAETFIDTLKKRGIPADEFTNRIRSFLVRNMSGEVCGDAGWIKQRLPIMPKELELINAQFKSPITTEDLTNLRIGEKAVDPAYWVTPKGTTLLQLAKALRFATDGRRLSAEERTAEEWHRKLLDFLDQLDQWDSSTELSDDDYFQQRCNMYRVLVDLCPDDLQRDAVLRAYGKYLKETNGTYKGRIEWISPVKDYLRILQGKDDKTMKASLDPWLTSSDNALRIYAELAILTLKRETS